ncbi:MAG: ABC transporter permease subunit/CPBP intramembrane protease [FCB group bacterium]|jgi:sodium transport system permease protein|nr:ABC transporter permease subunit/CPBP intramembrane protease [FCB group bacterium]
MNIRRILIIFSKELRDMLRDRRTLIAMIGMPIVLYPLLFIFGSQAAIMHQDKLDRTPSRIAFAPGTDPAVAGWFDTDPKFEVLKSLGAADDLYSGRVDAIVESPADASEALAQDRSVRMEVRFDAAESQSRQAMSRVSKVLGSRNDTLLDERLGAHQLDKGFAKPIEVRSRNMAGAAKTTGALLGTILPMLMVLMLGIGAFYPAIDLTAGEKERGTFETLLSTPTLTSELVYGKFLAVFCLSLLAGLLNLGSLLLTLGFQISQLGAEKLALDISMPPLTVLAILLVLIPLAFFISAVMMTAAMFARTFKEAQNIMTPFLLLILFPAMLAAMPGTELSAGLEFVPIANVALLFKDLMTGKSGVQEVFTVFISTTAYAVLALSAAVWIFKREEMILAEEHSIPFMFNRSGIAPRAVLTPGMALFLFGIVLVLIFYAGTFLQGFNFIGGLLGTQWGLVLAPTLLFLAFTRTRFREALNLRRPSLGALAGTVICGASWVVIVVQLGFWMNRALPVPPELAEAMAELYEGREAGLALLGLIFTAALSPAICEESLFRGAILSAFARRWPAWLAIVVTGLLFGLLHLSVYRMPVTAISGVVLAYLVYRSGSIYTGMLAHFMLNASALLAATQFAETLKPYRIDKVGEPLWVFATALVAFAAGVAIVEVSSRSRRLET